MYGTIIVGTDGSETAARAVERAVELASEANATLHVVSAYEPAPAHVARGASGEFDVATDFKADAALSKATDRADRSLEIKTHAPTGDPADAIIAIAERESADLIVLGSRGMRGARRLLGSVPNNVSHHAPCDVLIVRTD
jgi:nucleotide-binding universal stress UspA family protein